MEMMRQTEEKKARLSPQLLAKLKACDECRHSPVVFLTAEAIPVCDRHWAEIASSNIEW